MTYGVYELIFGESSNRVNLGELFHKYNGGITSIDRGVGSQRNNYYSTGVNRYGSSWAYGDLGSKTISVEFIINADINETAKFRKELATALDCPDGPRKLFFEDQPNGYYNAVVDGDVSLKESIGNMQSSGSITFVVPDGLWHSNAGKIIKSGKTSDFGKIEYDTENMTATATIYNDGNVEAYPIITIKNNSENGWYGIVGENGIMEIGTKEATIDGVAEWQGARQSQVLLDIKKGDGSSTTGWGLFNDASDTFSESPVSSEVAINGGKLSYITSPRRNDYKWGNKGLAWDVRTGTKIPPYKWDGGISTYTLPADKDGEVGAINFRCDFNIKIWESKWGQTGFMTVAFLDEHNDLVCAYDIAKPDNKGDNTYAKFEGPDGAAKVLGQQMFGANDNEKGRHRPNVAFNHAKGGAYIIKQDAKLTFGYNGKPYSYNVQQIQRTKVTKIAIIAGRYREEDLKTLGSLSVNVIESIKFTKFDTKKYTMVDNRYQKGTKLEVNMYEGTLRMAQSTDDIEEGVLTQGDIVIDSDFFSIPPGESKIEFLFSDFIKILPDIEIDINEQSL